MAKKQPLKQLAKQSSSERGKAPPTNKKKGIGRRTAVAALTVGGAIIAKEIAEEVPVHLAAKSLEEGVKRIWSVFAGSNESTSPRDLELIDGLFFGSECPFDVVPSGHHPSHLPTVDVGRVKTYANQLVAIRAISDLYKERPIVEDIPWNLNPNHSIIAIGSAASNLVTKAFLGDPSRQPHFRVFTHRGWIAVPYALVEQPGKRVWRLQDGKQHFTVDYAVVDENENRLAEPDCDALQKHADGSPKLKSDYLFVTRIPGRNQRTDVVLYSGLHGPAIRAIESLLYSLTAKDLRYLKDTIGSARYFQAVFRVGIAERGETTIPTEIELVRRGCPPRGLTVS